VVSVDAKSRLVYLRDCPSEVPDDVVKRFFSSFGEVHSISRSCHEAFPGIFDGNRVIKITMTKDVPGIVSVAGLECRVWYRRQPAFCAICKKLGHRSKSCPLNGLCRRCRRPGHHARDCSNACTVSSAVPCQLVDMDVSVEEVPGHKQFKTFRGVWEDKLTWEEFRARKPRYRVNVIPAEPSPSPTPSPSQSFSASSSTPVPPVSPVPSSFSSNGSVVDSVPTPTPERPRVYYQTKDRLW